MCISDVVSEASLLIFTPSEVSLSTHDHDHDHDDDDVDAAAFFHRGASWDPTYTARCRQRRRRHVVVVAAAFFPENRRARSRQRPPTGRPAGRTSVRQPVGPSHRGRLPSTLVIFHESFYTLPTGSGNAINITFICRSQIASRRRVFRVLTIRSLASTPQVYDYAAHGLLQMFFGSGHIFVLV